MAGTNGYRDLERGLEREAALLSDIEATEVRISELSRYLADLEDSPKVLERLARQELGLVAADDVVIILPESLWLSPTGSDRQTGEVKALSSEAPQSLAAPTSPSGSKPRPIVE